MDQLQISGDVQNITGVFFVFSEFDSVVSLY